MIARMWHGRTRASDARAYREFLVARALPDYRSVPGNLSVRILERIEGDVAHFVTLTCWENLEAVRGFAGDDIGRARYYEEDRGFLLEFEPTVVHYEVVASAGA